MGNWEGNWGLEVGTFVLILILIQMGSEGDSWRSLVEELATLGYCRYYRYYSYGNHGNLDN